MIAVSIEGSSLDAQTDQLPVSEGEELIDIVEYFGRENIQDARLVCYMQLKHSTLHAAEPSFRRDTNPDASRAHDLATSVRYT